MDPTRPRRPAIWTDANSRTDASRGQCGDEELVARVLEGEDGAFEGLVDRYGPVVRGYLVGRRVGREDAEDLFQEVFLAAYRELGRLRNHARLGPWLITIARHKLVNYRWARATRRSAPRDGSEEVAELVADAAPGPAERASLTVVRSYVLDAIAELGDRYRTVVYLRLIEEMAPHVIAERLDLKESTVRMRLSRGLAKLRKSLNRVGIKPPGVS